MASYPGASTSRAQTPTWLGWLGVLVIASFPWENALPVGNRSPSFVLNVVFVVAVLGFVLVRPDAIRGLLPPWMYLSAFAVFTYAAVSASWSLLPQETVLAVWRLGMLLLTTFAVALVCRQLWTPVLVAYWMSSFAVSVPGAFGFGGNSDFLVRSQTVRVVAFGNQNDTAVIIATGALIAVYLAVRLHGWARVACLVSLPVMAWSIVQSGSRATAMGLMLAITIMLYMIASRAKSRVLVVLVLSVGLLCCALWAFEQIESNHVGLRIFSVLDASSGGVALDDRMYLWQMAVSLSPGTHGYGFGTGRAVLGYFFGDPRAIHNEYLSWWLEFGSAGMLLVALFFGGITVESLRSYPARPLLAALWPMVYIAVGFYPLGLRRTFWITIVIAVLAAAIDRTQRERSGRPTVHPYTVYVGLPQRSKGVGGATGRS